MIEAGTNADGKTLYTVAPEGIRGLRSSGEAEPSGGTEHREILRDAYDVLARVGAIPEVPEQGGNQELPDGLADLLPGHDFSETDQPLIHAHEADALWEEYPIVHALTWGTGSPLTVESETETVRTKPKERTTKNARKAAAENRICLFFVADRTANSETLPAAHDAIRVEDAIEEHTDVSRDQFHVIVLPRSSDAEHAIEDPQVYLRANDDDPRGADLVPLRDFSMDDLDSLPGSQQPAAAGFDIPDF